MEDERRETGDSGYGDRLGRSGSTPVVECSNARQCIPNGLSNGRLPVVGTDSGLVRANQQWPTIRIVELGVSLSSLFSPQDAAFLKEASEIPKQIGGP